MKRKAQSATEYLFMLAAVLVIILFVTRITLKTVKEITEATNNYVTQVRKEILENL